MKTILKFFSLAMFLFWATSSCRKEESITPPKVETASADNISYTTARIGGKVTNDGGATITERGVYWDTVSNPEKTGNKIEIGSGSGAFFDTLHGLISGHKYYVKAYAVNKAGVGLGKETSFTTQIYLPTVTTAFPSNLTPTTATIGGNVTSDGGFAVSARGVFFGTKAAPQLTGNKISIGEGKGEYGQEITGLDRTKYYYVVAYATNIKGTTYGEEISFKTIPEKPIVNTIKALNITTNTAKLGGEILANGGAEIVEKGYYLSESTDPVSTGNQHSINSQMAIFYGTVENLFPKRTYYFAAYATNSVGTSYGLTEKFTTAGDVPSITPLNPTELKSTSVTLNGIVDSKNLETTVSFAFGVTTEYGDTVSNDLTYLGSQDTISITVYDLLPYQSYYYKMVATNELGTVTTHDSIFRTVLTGIVDSVEDSDGNKYKTIGIGYQRWMAENLRTTLYNNGLKISRAFHDTLWAGRTTEGYCWYNGDSAKYAIPYGALYNWYVVQTGDLCPVGWHVPTDSNYIELIDYLGSEGKTGGALKLLSTSYWDSPNTGATNFYEFDAPGGGKRLDDGSCEFMKTEGNWWTSVPYGSTKYAKSVQLMYDYDNIFQLYQNKNYGISVRCVEDRIDE